MAPNLVGMTGEFATAQSPLSNVDFRNKITETLSVMIDEACQDLYGNSYRGRSLPMSMIGEPCARKLWYMFRHVKKTAWPANILRIFNRGDFEEKRIISWLEKLGCEVKPYAENGKQHRVENLQGHFAGELDMLLKLPLRFKVDEWLLGECKTWKYDNYWKNLVARGVCAAAPKHYAQICIYGYEAQLRYCLYIALCKNTDAIYTEIVPINWAYSQEMLRKAEEIIFRPVDNPPPKIAQQPTHFSCKFCDFKEICHYNADTDINCRSCRFSNAANNKEWFCNYHKSVIPTKPVEGFDPAKGCADWQPLH